MEVVSNNEAVSCNACLKTRSQNACKVASLLRYQGWIRHIMDGYLHSHTCVSILNKCLYTDLIIIFIYSVILTWGTNPNLPGLVPP